jgi:hypothetical protein
MGLLGPILIFEGAGCVDELAEFDKIAWSDFGRRAASAQRSFKQLGFPQVVISRLN